MSNLTQVGSGSVTRPDITLKEDLTAIVETANTAKDTADDTAEMLETRVPEGRTINNKPLDQDLTFTPEDLDTYSRADIDAKIAAIVAGGYNPVKVNGHLLDRDIILTPADLGTFTGAEISTMIDSRVPITRTINTKPLSADIILTPADIGTYSQTAIDTGLNSKVPVIRTVNGKPLSGNIVLTPDDIGSYSKTYLDTALNNKANNSVSINGYDLRASFDLTAQDVGALAAEDAVPRTYRINGQLMTGTELTLTGVGVTPEELAAKLEHYIPFENLSGVATGAEVISTGVMADSIQGSGFYRYEPDGGDNMTDRPVGSTAGDLIVIKEINDDDPANIITNYIAFAIPDDLPSVYFRKKTGTWIKLVQTSDLTAYVPTTRTVNSKPLSANITLTAADVGAVTSADLTAALVNYLHTNAAGLVETAITMKNATPIRMATAAGVGRDVLNYTAAGVVEVGDENSQLKAYANTDPTVEIEGTSYKLYSEHFPPTGGGGLLKVSRITASGTFTKNPATKKVIVEVIGAGGGGGGAGGADTSFNIVCSGGGAGGYTRGLIDMTSLNTLTLTVGTGGNQGAAGTSSTVDGFITSLGGDGGVVSNVPTATQYFIGNWAGGGLASGTSAAELTLLSATSGAHGRSGMVVASTVIGGEGGSLYSRGGGQRTNSGSGYSPDGPGAGGGGAARAAGDTTTYGGGNGGNGLIIIWEYS